MMVLKSGSSGGGFEAGLTLPLITRPVVPSREIQSPALKTAAVPTRISFSSRPLDVARAGDATLAHSVVSDGGVTGDAAARSQDADRDFHPVDVFRSGLPADQDHGFLVGPRAGVRHASLAVKTIWPTAAPGEAGCPMAMTSMPQLSSNLWYKEVVELVGIHAEDGFLG